VRRIAAVLTLAACCVGATATSGSAATTGGCPSGAGANWQLVNARDFFGLPADFDLTSIPSLDTNNDGLTCVREVVRFPIEDRNNVLYRDNTV
jgi:hypothetical protein